MKKKAVAPKPVEILSRRLAPMHGEITLPNGDIQRPDGRVIRYVAPPPATDPQSVLKRHQEHQVAVKEMRNKLAMQGPLPKSKKRGRKPSMEVPVSKSIVLEHSAWEAIQGVADATDTSISAVLRELVDRFLPVYLEQIKAAT